MCNSYRITPKRGGDQGVRAKISAAAAKLASSLVRKSDPGIVVLGDEQVATMRWGFHRSFNPAINNTRSDKLDAGMWTEAFQQRRCVIPMSAFFEWGPGHGGRKQAHEFRDPEDDYLWIGGIWEHGEGEIGPCYSMVTTAASPRMAPIHDRMPAILRAEEIAGYLAGSSPWPFQPFAGSLLVTPCESPLLKPRASDSQQELF